MSNLTTLPGVSASDVQSLQKAGIRTTTQLLEAGATPLGRMRLADTAGLCDTTIKNWVHRCDLLRLGGMSQNLADALCNVGVCTLPKLAYQKPCQLRALLVAAYDASCPGEVPTESQLATFISQARELPKLVEH